jgi:hypothetical protein
MVLDEIKYYITSNTLAASSITYKAFMPDIPNKIVSIYEYSGQSTRFSFSSTSPIYEQPSIQIVTRSTEYTTARALADTIYKKIITVKNATLKPSSMATGCKYLTINAISPPFYLGRDASDRTKIVTNYHIQKMLST